MKNILFAAIVISLAVGTGIGYGFARYQAPTTLTRTSDVMSAATTTGHTMDSSMSGMVSDIKAQTGDARDATFLESMMVHHQAAIEMAQIISKETKRPELKQLADAIVSAQTGEITTMQKWLKEWFGR